MRDMSSQKQERPDITTDVKKDDQKDLEKKFVESTSDERVVNNIMRHEYRVLSDEEKGQMLNFKDSGLMFIELCNSVTTEYSRELTIAKTKMEEAVMWAVKHLTK